MQPSRPVVVAAAIVVVTERGSRLLAAQRRTPAQLAGWWELPGGKVEAGETEPAALARECREELRVEVEVGSRVGSDLVTAGGAVLRTYRAWLRRGSPVAVDHARLRWVAGAELAELAWLPADRALLANLRELLV